MESMSLIIGVLGISFLLFYFSNSLDTNNFWLNTLKLFIVLFALFFMLTIPKAMIDATCDLRINKTSQEDFYLYGNNFTYTGVHWDDEAQAAPSTNQNDIYLYHVFENKTFTYSEFCLTSSNTTAQTINKAYLYFIIFTSTFMILYFFARVFEYFKIKKND